MHFSALRILPVLVLSSLFFLSCSDDDFFNFPEPDFTTVPDAYDYSDAEPHQVEEGVTVYVLEEGLDNSAITDRDNVSVFFTLRSLDGEVVYSTFANDIDSPISVDMPLIVLYERIFNYEARLAFTPGLRKGLRGMREGETRTIIVEPEQGFRGVDPNSRNGPYRDDTLQYDVVLSRINSM